MILQSDELAGNRQSLGLRGSEFPVQEVIPIVGATDTNILSADAQVDKALHNGMNLQYADALRDAASQQDVWADEVGFGPPALRVTLRDDAIPFRGKQRENLPLHSQFLHDTVQQLIDRGLIRKNNGYRWASAAVPVRKPGTADKFRLKLTTVRSTPERCLSLAQFQVRRAYIRWWKTSSRARHLIFST